MKFKNNNAGLKFTLGFFYILLIIIFIWFIFTKYELQELDGYNFIKSNNEIIENFKNNNFILLFILFFLFIILWIFLLGFGTPIGLISGYIFGKWIGALLAIISLSVGALILYQFGKFFLYNFVKKKLYSKFFYLENKFKKNELVFMIIYRLLAIIPFPIANILPILFNVKNKNYFLGTLIGITPAIFIQSSFGSGIGHIIKYNDEFPGIFTMLSYRGIYLPIIAFFIIVILGFIFKKKFNLESK